MSSDNVDLVMSIYAAVERGDYEDGLALCADDIVWDMTGLRLPDLARVYHGRKGLGEFWTAWMGAWEGLRFTSLEPEDHGDQVIVAVCQRSRGRSSGVDVEYHYVQVTTVRDGLVACSVARESREEALAGAQAWDPPEAVT